MSNFFDHMHARLFEQLFGLDAASRAEMAAYLREMHFSEAEIVTLMSPGIKAGQKFGGCQLGDVGRFVDRLLFHQGAGHVVLRISRPLLDEAGHLEVNVVEVGPVPEQERRMGWWGGGAELPAVDLPPGDTGPSEAAELPDD